jgi:hypothetical protein
VDDGISGPRGSEQLKAKRLLAEQLRRDFEDMVEQVYSATEATLDINAWRVLIAVWMQRPETKQAFLQIIRAIEDKLERPYGKYLHPSNNKSFKDDFIMYAAVDLGQSFAEVYRDEFSWLAFMSGVSKRKTSRRKLTPSEQLGIG